MRAVLLLSGVLPDRCHEGEAFPRGAHCLKMTGMNCAKGEGSMYIYDIEWFVNDDGAQVRRLILHMPSEVEMADVVLAAVLCERVGFLP